MNTDKLNNYHFGRHVFEYFPWYSYSLNLESRPVLNKKISQDFLFAFKTGQDSIFFWDINPQVGHLSIQVYSVGYYDFKTIFVKDGIIRCGELSETVNDWEDIEKFHLRYLLGTKEKADEYFKIIDFYNQYHDSICDSLYLHTDEEMDVTIVSIHDFIQRDNKEVLMSMIEDNDVIDCLKSGKFRHSNFLDSVYKFHDNKGYLTHKQIDTIKKILYFDIVKNFKKDICFFYIKSNRIDNTERITDYLTYIGLKYKQFNDFILAYK